MLKSMLMILFVAVMAFGWTTRTDSIHVRGGELIDSGLVVGKAVESNSVSTNSITAGTAGAFRYDKGTFNCTLVVAMHNGTPIGNIAAGDSTDTVGTMYWTRIGDIIFMRMWSIEVKYDSAVVLITGCPDSLLPAGGTYGVFSAPIGVESDTSVSVYFNFYGDGTQRPYICSSSKNPYYGGGQPNPLTPNCGFRIRNASFMFSKEP